MALTAEDRKRLTNKQQQQIQIATTQYNRAKEKGDTAAMERAAADAAAVRKSAGYYTDSSGNYKGSYSGGGSSGGSSYSGGSSGSKNSPYTQSNYTIGSDYGKYVAQNMGIGATFEATDGSIWRKENDGSITVDYNGQRYKNAYTPTDLGILGTQQVEAGLDKDIVAKTYYDRINKIINNPELSKYMKDGTMQMMYDYIYGQNVEEEYEKNLDEFNEDRPEEYNNPYKKEIDFLLNQILNRDDFSYDALNDPLYQQYKQMYQREGDRAMKETMAEAAAGAGGMNTYAVTAAQQAANYYNSQLNDRIPELYQLAYNMYLDDKESKVQDLGILQNMDATQYARYQDTMQNWKDDRNFAYGLYQDAVQQGNYEKEFDYNSMLGDRDFAYNDFWNNKNWNAQQEQINIQNSRQDREDAKAQIMDYIKMGITSISPDLIAKAEMTQEEVNLAIAAAQAQNTKTGGNNTRYSDYSLYGDDVGGNPDNPINKTGVVKSAKDIAADFMLRGIKSKDKVIEELINMDIDEQTAAEVLKSLGM